MTTEQLVCKCGIEVGIVRLNAETLTLGHRVNPRNNRHPVRLSRSAENGAPAAFERGRSRRSEGPATRREDAPNAGPSYPRPRAGGLSTNGSPAERVHGPSTDKRSRPLERVSTRS